ncbi:hypothetical protein BOTCAL_0251g00020 [Botryotinia calthae]|uniref:Uncharacterized protein n=1 Tax=Botryotinia calthae TaxID=38488 RepID=A0A4Y8CYX0_9HELO|nr:hypothetical protein BOTCAL_0251g00020 [Botryotinia calthae]
MAPTCQVKRSSERIPIHLSKLSTNTARTVHPSSKSTTASSKPPMQDLSNGSEQTGGATPTRSEDPEGTVLPGYPVTADLKPLQGTPKGPIRRPHTTPQEEQSEIAKKLGESPEGDSLSNFGNQHELHLRNLSPRTETIPSRNPKEPVRDLYRSSRDLVEKSGESPEGNSLNNSLRNSVGLKTEQQVKTQVHHPRLSIIEVTEQRIIGSLPSLRPASPLVSRQPQEEPIRAPRRSLNKALKRDRRLLRFENQSSTVEVTRKNLPPNIASPQAVPSLGIAAAVQRRKAGRNETRR